jgi:hypothetical protein
MGRQDEKKESDTRAIQGRVAISLFLPNGEAFLSLPKVMVNEDFRALRIQLDIYEMNIARKLANGEQLSD